MLQLPNPNLSTISPTLNPIIPSTNPFDIVAPINIPRGATTIGPIGNNLISPTSQPITSNNSRGINTRPPPPQLEIGQPIPWGPLAPTPRTQAISSMVHPDLFQIGQPIPWGPLAPTNPIVPTHETGLGATTITVADNTPLPLALNPVVPNTIAGPLIPIISPLTPADGLHKLLTEIVLGDPPTEVFQNSTPIPVTTKITDNNHPISSPLLNTTTSTKNPTLNGSVILLIFIVLIGIIFVNKKAE